MRAIAIVLLQAAVVAICLAHAGAKEQLAEGVPTALQEYVGAKDDAFAWKILSSDSSNGCLVYDVDLTSQVWQGITWKHALTAIVPPNVRHKDVVLLFIMGGSTGKRAGNDDLEMGRKLASNAQMPVVLLYQVPNQPLLGDKKEDDLISET